MRRPAAVAGLVVSLVAVAAAALVVTPGRARAAGDDDLARQLAERYAPVIMLKSQDGRCDDGGEPYRPSRVDVVLDNHEVSLRQVGSNDPVARWGPGARDLAGLGSGWYLDFPGDSLEPGCTYERDFRTYTGTDRAAVYAHVVQQPDVSDRVFVQYWFYWYYNDWNNKHESDWEGITVVFDAGSVEEALAAGPIAVGYSQHGDGERSDWTDPKLTKDGDHPIVYSSAGSHASYFGSAIYLGRSGGEGFGCDDTSGPSTRVDPEVILLPHTSDGPDDEFAWLSFEGRWGQRQRGSFNAPTGPSTKERWTEPAPWFEGLRESSVVIPAGDADAASVVGVFCAVVEAGSAAVIDLVVSPVEMLLAAAIFIALVRFVCGRTVWNAVDPRPIVRRRRAGQIMRAAMRTYRRAPHIFVAIGLVYIPAMFVVGAIGALLSFVPLVSDLFELTHAAEGTNLVLALLIGSVSGVVSFQVVNSIVAEYLQHDGRGRRPAMAAAHEVWRRRADIAATFGRSFVAVALLLISFVGIPIAILLIGRYQFISQVVMIEEASARRALRRSSELVRGRWFHTALIAAVLNGSIGAAATVVGLVLLVVATGIPLVLMSAIVGLVYATFVPFAAIAMTLLYGDAVAEFDERHDEHDEHGSAVPVAAPS